MLAAPLQGAAGLGPTPMDLRGADTGVMMLHGTPRWVMVLFGAAAAVGGLYLWNGQGEGFGFGRAQGEVDRRHTVVSVVMLVLLVGIELVANWL